MKNSYDDSASSDVHSHLFGWAVDDNAMSRDVAADLIKESASEQLDMLREQQEDTAHLNEMSDFCVAVVDALEESGFNADFELLSEGRVKISFDDESDRFDRRRMHIAENIIGSHAEDAAGVVTRVNIMEHANGGDITVGLTMGVGFANSINPGIDPNFDPFEQKHYKFVNELNINLDDATMDRIDELTSMWDGDYDVYNEGADITLRKMSPEQRDMVSSWIVTQTKRVGVPGSKLEEVLHDMHMRIRKIAHHASR